MAEHAKITPQSVAEAAKGNDLDTLETVADDARVAIARSARHADVTFEGAAAHAHGIAEHEIIQVREALTQLEGRIAQLRAANAPPKAAPQQDAPAAETGTSPA